MEMSEEQIKHRQELFCMTVKSCFLVKINKYQNLLRKHVHIDDSLEEETQLSNDDIELVLGASHQYKPRFTCRQLGYQLGSAGLFRLVLYLMQKVKARRILAHLSGIPQSSAKTTILDIAREISVAFEYQLVMLYSDEEIIRLAQHAVAIFMTYLNQNEARFTHSSLLQALLELSMLYGDEAIIRLAQHAVLQFSFTYLNQNEAQFTPASLLQALLEVKPKCSKSKEIVRTCTANWNNESVCYKWKLGQIFKQPGLRILNTDQQNQGHETGHDIQGELQGQVSNSEPQNTLVLDEGVDEMDCTRVTYEHTLSARGIDMNVSKSCQIELDNVSSIILGQHYMSREKSQVKQSQNSNQRRISTLDMDFEQGTLNINEYQVDLNSDFSPISPNDSDKVDFKQDDVIPDNNDEHKAIPTVHNEEFQANISQTIPSSNKECLFTEETYPNGANDMDTTGTEMSRIAENNVKVTKCNEKLEVEELSRIDLSSHQNESSHTRAMSFLSETQCSEVFYKFYGCFTPYGAKCQPSIYGFRGPLYAWDDNEMKWGLIYNDQVSIHATHCNEIKNTSCFHQQYQPKTSSYHQSL